MTDLCDERMPDFASAQEIRQREVAEAECPQLKETAARQCVRLVAGHGRNRGREASGLQ